MWARGALADPFALKVDGTGRYPPAADPRGRPIRDPRTSAGERTVCLITAGQSNIANWAGEPYVVANSSKIDNLSIYDGGLYGAEGPVLGADGRESHWPLRLGDLLIDGGRCDRVILIPTALGATKIDTWAPGGIYDQRVTVAFRRSAALGIPVTAVLWQQGEAEAGTTQSSWEASFAALVGQQQELGHTAPWLVGRSTWGSPTRGFLPAIQAAQAAVVNGTTVFAGGNTDSMTTSAHRQPDSSHFTAAGAQACAVLWRDALIASGIV